MFSAVTNEHPTSTRNEAPAIFLFIALVLAFPFGLASASKTFADGDVSWHIATGRWMFEHAQIPRVDPFSFSASGRPWIAMEWLADLLYAGAYNLAGYAGLATVVAAALIVLNSILFWYLSRRITPFGVGAAIIAANIVLSPFIVARPHVLVWPLLAGWTALLFQGSETGRPPPLWAAVVMLVWTNLHGSFPLGLLIAGAVALDALIEAHGTTLREWSVFLGASMIATLCNANGLDGLLQPFRITNLDMLPRIAEWQASSPSLTPQFYIILSIGLGAILWRGVKMPPGRLLLLLGMLLLAFAQQRHQSWFAIVAALSVPSFLGAAEFSERRFLPWLAIACPLLIARSVIPLTPTESAGVPRNLLAAIPAALKAKPVLNGYTFGGPLILAGIRPYIDGRAELYGDAFFADYTQILSGDSGRFNRAVQKYDIRWAMLPASNKRLTGLLNSSRTWKLIYSDSIGVIYVRRVST
jgi:hypothetical protein